MNGGDIIQVTRRRFSGMMLVTAKLVFVSTAAVIALVRPTAVLDATGMGGLLPQWAAILWVATVLALCVFAIGMLGCRRLEMASSAMLLLAFLIAANGAVSVSVNGLGSTWAANVGYAVAALAFLDRSRALHDYGRFGPGPIGRTEGH